MQKAFLSNIEKQKLFKPTDKILLAVSGGKDSVVLTELFRGANMLFGIAHCNFQLRGEESDQDEDFVRNLAKNKGVKFFFTKFQTKKYAKEKQISTQMAARELRYEWFEKIRTEHDFQYVATAHHVNDNIETILLNLTKGTGIAGLTGISPKKNYLIRPLLFASRQEIDDFALEKNLQWREDSSNQSDDYQRNLLRHQVIPVLKSINPNLESTFLRNIERFEALEIDFQKNLQAFKKTVLREENGVFFLKIENIKYWQTANYLLEEILKDFGFNYFQTKEIHQSIHKQSGKVFHSETHTLYKDREDLIISKKNDFDYKEISIENIENEIEFGTKIMSFKLVDNFSEIAADDLRNPNNAFLNFSLLNFPLKIRLWKEGDYFQPYGMKGKKKKISDFLIDSKVSLNLKKVIFLLVSNKQIVWVIGNRSDHRFRVDKSTSPILQICIR